MHFFFSAPRNVEGNAEMVTVVDLLPWTEYEFQVIATNTLGTGEPSEPSSKITTQEAGMPLDFIVIYLLQIFEYAKLLVFKLSTLNSPQLVVHSLEKSWGFNKVIFLLHINLN